jgi:hypothetical protein
VFLSRFNFVLVSKYASSSFLVFSFVVCALTSVELDSQVFAHDDSVLTLFLGVLPRRGHRFVGLTTAAASTFATIFRGA